MDAMADDLARAVIPSPLPWERARLARAFQGISNPGGRAFVDGSALRGTECLACQSCGPRRSLAVVVGCGVGRRKTCGAAGLRADTAERELAGVGQSAAKRRGVGGIAKVHRARHTLRQRIVATCDGQAVGPGGKPSSARPSTPIGVKVECPLLPPRLCGAGRARKGATGFF